MERLERLLKSTFSFEYQNALVVLRSVVNDVELGKVANSILPDLNEINTPCSLR